MSWKAALVARLLDSPDIFALTGNNIEWDERAPDAPLPAITLQTISDPRPQNHDGFDAFRGTRVQVNCLARTATQAAALLELAIPVLVLPAVVGATTFLQSFVDGGGSDAERTPTGRICRERTDLIIWHN
jgi:hypothetical protein